MDVDNELDGGLLEQFSSMGTTDKEVLLSEFQKLLGNQLNPAGCEFFLEMNKWNLQAAICAYYDFEQPAVKLPSMSFVRDITIGEGESVPPDTNFVKSWQVQNSGDEKWPAVCLHFIGGEQFGHRDRVYVEPLDPGAVTGISIEMHSPSVQGIYQGQWRMRSEEKGMYFGDTIWVILQVDTGGILSVTQQMSRFGSDFTENRDRPMMDNPFATPTKLSSSLPNSSAFPMQGSPSSVIAQHGSTPNSPRLLDTSSSSPNHPVAPQPLFHLNNHARQTLFMVTPPANIAPMMTPVDPRRFTYVNSTTTNLPDNTYPDVMDEDMSEQGLDS